MSVQPASPGAAFFRPGTGPTDPPRATPNAVRDESHRIEEQCSVCGKWDDHPKHSHGDPVQGWVVRHLDCCAAAGCPLTGHPTNSEHACGEVLRASGQKHGPELTAWLTGKDGKAHTERVNRLADARRIVQSAAAGAALHERMAEDNAAHAEHSRDLLAQAQDTVRELTS